MYDTADSLPEGVLEDMAYLSRSENRMRILHALSQCPIEPRELTERTDIPRSTVGRIVTELNERGWVERTLDGEYVATPLGELMAVETRQYIESIRAIRSLDSAVSWLPADELTVDVHHFGDARVIGHQMNDAVAPDTYAIERIRESNEFRNLTNIAPTLGFESALHDGVETGTLSSEHVVTPGVLPKLRMNEERRRRWQAYLDAGADLYLSQEDIPCNLFIMDDTVFIADSQLESLEYIEVEDSAVLSWAHRVIDSFRQGADRLGSDSFAPNSGASPDNQL